MKEFCSLKPPKTKNKNTAFLYLNHLRLRVNTPHRFSPENRKALLLALIAFVLPLSRPLASLMIVVTFLHELICYAASRKCHLSNPLKASIVLFFFYALSALYSEDWLFAWHKLETKLCLLVCPLIWGLNFNPRAGRYLPVAFVLGNALAVFYSLGAAAIDTWQEGVNHFHYMKLSAYLHFHPTIFSLYLFTAVFLLLRDIDRHVSSGHRKLLWAKWSLVLLFLLFILLLSARMAMLSGFLLLSIYLFLLMKQRWGWAKSLSTLSLLVLLGLGVAWSIPSTRFRLQVLFEGENRADKSPNIRWEIWDAATYLIRKGPVWGYGLGDVDEQLMATYELMDYCKPYGEQYNAHNQFLQTTLAIGWPGLLAFLLLFMLAFRQIYSRQNPDDYPALFFLLLFFLNALTESLLQVQQSLIFFSLFFSYFFFVSAPEEK